MFSLNVSFGVQFALARKLDVQHASSPHPVRYKYSASEGRNGP